MLADNAASNANNAATAANNAAVKANTSAAGADASAQNANEKADAANIAASNANTAASNANAARDAADTAASSANTAATKANNAASNADLVVTECNTAIYNANVAAASATRAGDRADSASEMIEGITVTSQSVGPNDLAEATITEINGHKNIHFRLRQGATGAPYIIKGNAYETLGDLESAISSPAIGDQYNVGTEPPYNIYRWTGTQWENQGAIGISVSEITSVEIDAIRNNETVDQTSGKYLDIIGLSYYVQKTKEDLNVKVDKVTGKGLSTNDFTNEYKNKVDALGDSVSVLVNSKVDKVTGKGLSTNDFTNEYKTAIAQNVTDIDSLESGKVDKIEGKGLSTNDFTDYYVMKIAELEGMFDILARTGTIWRRIEDSSGNAIQDSNDSDIEGRVVFARQ